MKSSGNKVLSVRRIKITENSLREDKFFEMCTVTVLSTDNFREINYQFWKFSDRTGSVVTGTGRAVMS